MDFGKESEHSLYASLTRSKQILRKKLGGEMDFSYGKYKAFLEIRESDSDITATEIEKTTMRQIKNGKCGEVQHYGEGNRM